MSALSPRFSLTHLIYIAQNLLLCASWKVRLFTATNPHAHCFRLFQPSHPSTRDQIFVIHPLTQS